MSHSHALERLWAAAIVYQPNLNALATTLAALTPQVQAVVVVDNTPNASGLERLCRECGVRYLAMQDNSGTGAAMNRVWSLVNEQHADGLVCFDQDSTCGPGLVERLRANWNALHSAGQCPGAVGPIWRDQRNGTLMTTLTPRGWTRRPVDRAATTEVDHLITSGCLIPRTVFEHVGPYNEDFFLDCVDIEWSLRARDRGYRLFVVRAAELGHTIGDGVVHLGGKSLMVHSPIRTYLMVRNHVALWKTPWISNAWRLRDMAWVFARSGALLVLAPQKTNRLAAIFRGLWHGMIGKTGRPSGL